MNTVTTLEIASNKLEDTLRVGEKIGQNLRGSEVIELAGDLGSGKTVLVRGMAHGLGSPDTVASPTFTISRAYRSDTLTLHHYDFYRLDDPGVMKAELEEKVGDAAGAVVIEWSDIVGDVLPKGRLTIEIGVSGATSRTLVLKVAPNHAHLLKGL